jgi:DNA-binding winged helix-turn-helix (wHTH) protein
LLYFLADNPNRAFTREVLLEQVWGTDYYGDIRTVDTHVRNIREKLRKADLHTLLRICLWIGIPIVVIAVVIYIIPKKKGKTINEADEKS